MKLKTCSSCKIEKESSMFAIRRDRACGLTSECKQCRNAKYKTDDRRKAKRESLAKKRLDPEFKMKERSYSSNKILRAKSAKKWRDANPEKAAEVARRYRQNNLEKCRIAARKKRNSDAQHKLAHVLRSRMRNALKGSKKSLSSIKNLGCSVDELKVHIESQFSVGMTWDNYGKWEIDHIYPVSKFDLTKEDEWKACCHYTNLRPLWKTENRKKFNKVITPKPWT